MSMKNIVGIAMLGVGILLLFLGYQSSQGMDDRVSEAVTGEYTDSTLWYWVLGAIGTVGGAALFLIDRR
ncbi:MAG: DUF3185 family protein [Gammaproteobacteria bacterium]|nr:DUF3185 family protein [Gammaproteobacteria bacterium]TVQ45564.1 MAG: DUF3185 family protein [Gammaproteobacteria bacterium]